MADSPQHAYKEEPAGKEIAGPLDLLLSNDFVNSAWEATHGKLRAYYVRGATEFMAEVFEHQPVSHLLHLDAAQFDVDTLFEDLPHWKIKGFDWNSPFSARQAMDALTLTNRKPVRFDKAVKTILLCHRICKERANGTTSFDCGYVLRNMRIEPAVYYIRDFDANFLAAVGDGHAQVVRKLTDAINQPTRAVLEDLAEGKTVTLRLAEIIVAAFKVLYPNQSIGSVDHRYSRFHRKGATQHEILQD